MEVFWEQVSSLHNKTAVLESKKHIHRTTLICLPHITPDPHNTHLQTTQLSSVSLYMLIYQNYEQYVYFDNDNILSSEYHMQQKNLSWKRVFNERIKGQSTYI